jgi:Ca-activated chloride channel family protein
MKDQTAILTSSTGVAMALEGVEAKGRVRGLLFELHVEQRYRNQHGSNIEAVYTFPVPSDAVLLDLDVTIGERKLVATVVEKKEAERNYEEAIDKGDTAIMLERSGDGLCTLNLGNLMPGERATIHYRYAQLLRFEHGSARLTIPTVIAPRYGDPRAAGLAAHQVPTNDLAVAYPFTLSLDLEGEIATGTIASPSHALAIAATATGMHVALARGAFLDRDFVLTIAALAGKSLAVVARDGDRYVALASFCADVPREAATLPLTLKLVVDCSGSMNGDSIGAARRALHGILASLDGGDRFSLTRFGSNVVHETSGLVPAGEGAVRDAAERVGRMNADLGGTEMAAALRTVFALNASRPERATTVRHEAHDATRDGTRYDVEGTPADVLMLTDGEIWNADELIGEARRARQRVFVVGIGSAPAEGVLRRLADATGGACEFVAPNEDAEAAILRMFARLRAPRIERADVAWPMRPAWAVPLPTSLFGGETIHAFAGFERAPVGATVLHLHSRSGASPLSSAVQVGAAVDEDRTLARLAAARRIETASEADQLRLALDYGLLTSRTNLLVVYERAAGEKAIDLPRLAHVANMHAAGWHGVGSVGAMSMSVDNDILSCPAMIAFDKVNEGVVRRRSMLNELTPPFLASRSEDAEDIRRSVQMPDGDRLEASAALVRFVSALDRSGAASVNTFADLARLGIGLELLAQLRALVAAGAGEVSVVKAFLEAVAIWDESRHQSSLSRHLRRTLRHLFDTEREGAAMRTAVRRIVTNAVAARV